MSQQIDLEEAIAEKSGKTSTTLVFTYDETNKTLHVDCSFHPLRATGNRLDAFAAIAAIGAAQEFAEARGLRVTQ